jgi:hypothetical protein
MHVNALEEKQSSGQQRPEGEAELRPAAAWRRQNAWSGGGVKKDRCMMNIFLV